MKLIYAYATYAILGLIYSLVNIPYGSLASAITQSVHERAKLVAARAFGAGIGGVVLTFVVGNFISDLRGQKALIQGPEDLIAYQAAVQGVFTKVTLAFIVIGSIAFFFTAWACREAVVRTQPRISIKETFGTLSSNKPLAYLCGSSFFYLIGVFAVGGTTAFYAQYVLGNIGLVGIITLVNTGITLLITPFIPKIIDRFGKKNVFQFCGVFTIVGGVGLFFAPANMFWLVLLDPGHQGHRGQLDQHRDVRPGGRHRRVRGVEDRQAQRGCHVRAVLLHPQGHPVHRRRGGGVGPGHRRLHRGQRGEPQPDPARQPRSSRSRPPSVCCPPSLP